MHPSASSNKLPFDLRAVYGTHPIQKEWIVLDNEVRGKIRSQQARVRLLTDFLFVKHGQFVFPDYDSCTDEFWDDVEVWGFMMSPTGSGRWLAWSLLWHLDWREKHMELVHITNVIGLSKEAHKSYRNGNQVALWLNTLKGYTYALMQPEDLIEKRWGLVCSSWLRVNNENVPVPYCGPVQSLAAPPAWWHENNQVAGKQTWQQLVKQQTEHLKKQEDAEDDDEDEEFRSPSPTPAASTKKGKGKNAAEPRGKRKRRGEEQALLHMASGRQTRKPRQSGEGNASSAPSTSRSKVPPIEVADKPTPAVVGPPASSDGSQSSREDVSNSPVPPSPKRIRREAALEQAKDRAKREAVASYSPGPSTQAANVLPTLKLGCPAPLVFVPDSSPTRARVSPKQNPAASQGSQLALQASELSMADGDGQSEEGGAEEADSIAEVDAAVSGDAGAGSAPDVVRAEDHGVVPSGSSVLVPPDTPLTSDTAPSTNVPALAVSSSPTAPATAPVLASTGQSPLPGLPRADPIPAAPAVGAEMGHQVVAVSDSGKSVIASLDDRSSRRRQRGTPA